jgi:hypothetical protein
VPEPKTKKTRASVDGFLDSIKDEQRRADCRSIRQIMEKATSSKGQMWGAGIVGFGEYSQGRQSLYSHQTSRGCRPADAEETDPEVSRLRRRRLRG